MDITTIRDFRAARTDADLALIEGETLIAGGTWLMSEPQPTTTGFVDLTTMGWPDLEVSDAGLRIGATCTIARLVRWAQQEAPAEWTAAPLAVDAANALLASFKIWNTATVGGNVCRSFAAAGMVSLAVALDGVAVIWSPRPQAGTTLFTERRQPVADIITGNGTNSLDRGEVLRAIEIPVTALRSRAALRKIALAEHGRSGAVVTGRVDPDGSSVFAVTAATAAPTVWRFGGLPAEPDLADAVAGASGYYTDPLGAADWRRGVSVELARRVRAQLEDAA
ncbi:FAD binding domain-containing protein [Microbacterium xanthum]|uniref:FAD binding domain-containing protein n=1 Tax=Microbacterium xanthum TaxID=3079794 RepID=UPI002AD48F35|nr:MULTISPECIES: FAD binding domain-containing protein [unclassified Microbacterium]MDZ8171404.1 FAD binding domain-containing protein [Microbacterium sp. KSW-48]MDZ8200558.1 FAD binding domain-containing protein [Microbacterium sp. SSW1-59]